jgi:hypothetical protein
VECLPFYGDKTWLSSGVLAFFLALKIVFMHPKLLISALFWDMTWRSVLIVTDVSGQRIGPIFKGQEVLSFSDSWPMKMGPIRCPETSVNSNHTTPRNIPEKCRSHQHRGSSLKYVLKLLIALRNLGSQSDIAEDSSAVGYDTVLFSEQLTTFRVSFSG